MTDFFSTDTVRVSVTNMRYEHNSNSSLLNTQLQYSHFESLDSPLGVCPTEDICWTIVINDARQMPIGDHVSGSKSSSPSAKNFTQNTTEQFSVCFDFQSRDVSQCWHVVDEI